MTVSVTNKIHFGIGVRGRRELRLGDAPEAKSVIEGRVPRIARLMALAIRFEKLIAQGAITDQAELARLGHVTRARVTQVMNLIHLAPDIQEAILHLPRVIEGRDPITERQIRPIAHELDWGTQREMWANIVSDLELV